MRLHLLLAALCATTWALFDVISANDVDESTEEEEGSNFASPGKCVGEPDPGPCMALMPRYYYDAKTNGCKRFNYGGCRGNANNFLQLADCQRSCNKRKTTTEKPAKKPCWRDKRRCVGPPVTGPCRAAIPRFYYDAASNSCKSFTYGGCGGNDNHWIHEENCVDVCIKSKTNEDPHDNGIVFFLPPLRPDCPVRKCSKHCPYGHKSDKHGCSTCHCLKGPIFFLPPLKPDCPVRKCSEHCPYGHKRDKHGCSTCHCLKGPIFFLPPIRPHCPVRKCTKHCPHGHKRDRQGCSTCHCLGDRHCRHGKHHKHHKHHKHSGQVRWYGRDGDYKSLVDQSYLDGSEGRHLIIDLKYKRDV